MALPSEIIAAFNHVLWVVVYASPFLFAMSRSLMDATHRVRPGWLGGVWAILILAGGLATGVLAGVGTGFAYNTQATEQWIWTTTTVLALVHPVVLGLWAYFVRPGVQKAGVAEWLFLILAIAVGVFNWILLGVGGSGDTDRVFPNRVPFYFFIPLIAWHLLVLSIRLAETVGKCGETMMKDLQYSAGKPMFSRVDAASAPAPQQQQQQPVSRSSGIIV